MFQNGILLSHLSTCVSEWNIAFTSIDMCFRMEYGVHVSRHMSQNGILLSYLSTCVSEWNIAFTSVDMCFRMEYGVHVRYSYDTEYSWLGLLMQFCQG